MTATTGYALKRALFLALEDEAGTGRALDGATVLYAMNAARATDTTVYLGGFRGPQDVDAVDGPDNAVVAESLTIGVYVRVVRDTSTVEDPFLAAEMDVERFADAVGHLIARRHDIAGHGTYARITATAGDYSDTGSQAIVVCALQVQVDARFQP